MFEYSTKFLDTLGTDLKRIGISEWYRGRIFFLAWFLVFLVEKAVNFKSLRASQ